MRVKAAVARHHGAPLVIESLDLAEPREGEILVRLLAAGVAHRDREAIAGTLAMPLPFVPGTEAAGLVERVGEGVASPAAGDAVLIGYAACGTCANCAAGDTRHCQSLASLNLSGRRPNGTTPFTTQDGDPINGLFFGQSAFATHVVCRAVDAVVVDKDAPLELFAPLCGEVLTGAAPLLALSEIKHDDAIVIIGAGTIGLTACMIAKARGIGTIIVGEPDERRRQLATDLGATLTVPDDERFSDVVRSMRADGVRFALETSGSETGRQACLESLATNSTCAAVRLPSSYEAGATDARWTAADAGIVTADLVPQLIALYARGVLPLERLIDFFAFEHVNDALAAVAAGAIVKPVLRFALGPFGDLDRAETEGAATDIAPLEPSPEPEGAGETGAQMATAE